MTSTIENLQYLERDRWPELDQELRNRRSVNFDVHHYGADRQLWEWAVGRCRTWDEVTRVLNHHKARWEKTSGEIRLEGMSIFKLR